MPMQANLTKYTEEELDCIRDQIEKLEIEGKEEEAIALSLKSIPMNPARANIVKNSMGIGFLLKHQINLSKTIDKFGMEWLEQ